MGQSVRLRKEVRWFAEQMELKLRDNDHKGRNGWHQSTNGYLQGRIADELKEIQEEKFPYHKIEECFDCANFCMMLADNIKHERG